MSLTGPSRLFRASTFWTVVAVALVGCGGSGTSTGTDASTSTDASTAPADAGTFSCNNIDCFANTQYCWVRTYQIMGLGAVERRCREVPTSCLGGGDPCACIVGDAGATTCTSTVVNNARQTTVNLSQ